MIIDKIMMGAAIIGAIILLAWLLLPLEIDWFMIGWLLVLPEAVARAGWFAEKENKAIQTENTVNNKDD